MSQEIEDEEQVLGLQDDVEPPESGEPLPQEEGGLEMQNDFEGALHDVDPSQGEKEDDDDGEEEEEEELQRQMGDLGQEDEKEVVDEKLWNDESDEEDLKEDEQFEPGKPLPSTGEDEVRESVWSFWCCGIH